MNAERLLAHYETIANAPDAIARLRRFILDLAVRGKLVPQDPNDEPATELLKRIAKEKDRLVKAGEISKFNDAKPAVRGDLAFAIPAQWHPAKIGQVLNELQTGPFGSSLHQSDYRVGGTPVINPASIQDGQIVPIDKMAVDALTLEKLASFKLRSGDVIMARRGEMGRCAIVGEREAGWLCGTGSLILRPSKLVSANFLVLLISSPFGRGYLGGSAVGTTMQNLNQTILLRLPFGLPPLAEQHRIIAKVDELMMLSDRLEAARANREIVRDRLAAVSLARLDAPNTETFQADSHFVLDTLPALTARPDQIRQLRQTILNLAVRGKLVSQNPNDEPAKGFEKPNDPAAPFDLPGNWKWIRIGNQLHLLNGMAFKPTDWRKSGLRIVRIQNLNNPDAPFNFCDPEMIHERSLIDDGSFLISWSGTPGTSFGAFIWNRGPAVVNQHIFRCDFKTKAFSASFLRLAVNGRLDEMIAKAHGGVGLQHITKGKLEALVIPLPPLAEQHRIVAKVDALMTLCDRLEASLTAAAAIRRRLLEALLAEALAPVEELELKAAE